MRILITGASGFLGGHLVDAFVKDLHQVKVLIRKTSDITHLSTYGKNIDYVYGDIEDPISCHSATQDIDIVIHSAARAMDYGNYKTFEKTNIEATKNLLTAAKKNRVQKFLFISSPSVVAEFKDQININEQYPYPRKAMNYYCDSKAKAERYVLSQNGYGIYTTIIRPRGIWGPRDKTGFLPKLMKRIATGKLKNLSGGRPVLTDLCHVYNVSHACLLASKSDKVGGNIYFITDDSTIEVWTFLNHLAILLELPEINKTIPSKIPILAASVFEILWKTPYLKHHKSMPLSKYSLGLLTRQSTYNISKAKKDFAYQPIINERQGIQNLLSWINQIGGVSAFTKHV